MDGLWWCAERFGRVSFHFLFLQLFVLGYSESGETARWISHKCEMELQLVLPLSVVTILVSFTTDQASHPLMHTTRGDTDMASRSSHTRCDIQPPALYIKRVRRSTGMGK